jgi:hypothetical protein
MRTGGMVQVVESLLCKCRALCSNSSPTKKKKIEFNSWSYTRPWWLTPIILATQEAEIIGSLKV